MDGSILHCKMKVTEVLLSKSAEGKIDQERVKLMAVYGAAGTSNGEWSKYTPSANFEIHINNPDAFGKLSAGHEFFVDFTPATE